jgi:Mg2+-importing ATPase
MGPLADYFKLQPLPLAYFPILAALLIGYAALAQAMKAWYSARYGWQ